MFKINCIIPSNCSEKSLQSLRECVKSIDIESKRANVKIKKILVTNGKSEDVQNVRKFFDLVYQSNSDFNFSSYNNKGIELGLNSYDSDYFMFINDDAKLGENFFIEFRLQIRKEQADLLNPLIEFKNKSGIDSYGIEYLRSGYAKNVADQNVSSSLATASVLLMATHWVKKIQNKFGFIFNPILQSYYEDVELSIRALGLGAKIKRCKKMLAFHSGSFSFGIRSKHQFYQSYRNVLWVILICWPLKNIMHNLMQITVVQLWFFINGVMRFGLFFSISYVGETLFKLKLILNSRRNTISKYKKDFNFDNILSDFMFRKRSGVTF